MASIATSNKAEKDHLIADESRDYDESLKPICDETKNVALESNGRKPSSKADKLHGRAHVANKSHTVNTEPAHGRQVEGGTEMDNYKVSEDVAPVTKHVDIFAKAGLP